MFSAIKGLAKGAKSNSFAPGDSVFPDLAIETLASRLKPAALGASRGADDLPATEVAGLDQVESEIVGEVDKHRRRGLNTYDEHMQVYAQRLARAVDARARIEAEASTARTNFETSAQIWANRLANESANLEQRRAEYDAFRRRHRLTERGAVEPSHFVLTIGLFAFMFLGEGGANAYFFANSNALGWIGGASTAFAISLVNVGFCTLFGFFSRWLVHRNYLGKFAGLVSLVLFFAFFVGFNLAVGHFRDAADGRPWDEATVAALATFQISPFVLQSIESWLLVGVGGFVSIICFWKGFRLDDPYPGFGRVHRALSAARHAYSDNVETAHEELLEKRDEAKRDLESAGAMARTEINDTVHVAYARQGLTGNRDAFLNHCEETANALLRMYREANARARSTPAPAQFSQTYQFPGIKDLHEADAQQGRAKDAVARIETAVEGAVKQIFDAYDLACRSHARVSDIEAGAAAAQSRASGEAA